MPLKKLSSLLVILLTMTILLSACGTTASTTGAVTATTAVSADTTATQAPAGDPNAVLTLAESTLPTFNRNYNPFVTTCLPGTNNVIHEPLMILNGVKGELVPWLATEYKWSEDLKKLSFTIRDGVLWSDGQPFTAADVAFTFNLLKTAPGVNSSVLPALVGDSAYVESITAPDAKTVEFVFKRAYTPGLYELISQNIVPEHIWKSVTDVVAYTNDKPVGNGPFHRGDELHRPSLRSGQKPQLLASQANLPSRVSSGKPSPTPMRRPWQWPMAISTGPTCLLLTRKRILSPKTLILPTAISSMKKARTWPSWR